MRDLRVPVIPAVSVVADTAYNGETIDLLASVTGAGDIYGTSLEYGLGGIIMAKSVVTGTGDGFTVVMKAQHSLDGSAWDDYGELGTFTIDTDGNFLKADGLTVFALTRQKLSFRIRTARRYVRLVGTAAGITNGESLVLAAWLADGSNPFMDTGVLS